MGGRFGRKIARNRRDNAVLGPGNFNLAPLSKVRPEVVLPQDNQTREERFFLALAVVFNDLKDIFWLVTTLKDLQPSDMTKIEPVAGQISGMRNHWFRLAVGLINELLVLFKKNKDVLESETVTTLVGALHVDNQNAWREIVDMALEQIPEKRNEPPSSFANSLRHVRNSAVFHYSDTEAMGHGFNCHFYQEKKGAYSDSAYFSEGKNAEETRFYFADAAVMGVIGAKTAQDVDEWLGEMSQVAFDINHVLGPLLMDYIELRKQRAKSNEIVEGKGTK